MDNPTCPGEDAINLSPAAAHEALIVKILPTVVSQTDRLVDRAGLG